MPRKVRHGIDYAEDYDYYDNYEDDYDYGDDDEPENEHGDEPKTTTAASKPGTWQCSICTYENEENLSVCDVCGVVRDYPNNTKEIAGDFSKVSGASKMAKALLSSSPHEECILPILYRAGKDGFTNKEVTRLGKISRNFSDFLEVFVTPDRRYRFSIDPFRFDSASPDDVTSSAKNTRVKPLTVTSKPDKGSSAIVKNKGIKVLPDSQKSSNSLSSSTKEGSTVKDGVGRVTESKPSSALRSKGFRNRPTSSEDASSSYAPEAFSQSRASGETSTSNGSRHDDTYQYEDGLSQLKLNATSISEKMNRTIRKAVPVHTYKPEGWMLPAHGEGTLTQLSMAIVGHVDSGKSSLSGRLLHVLGRISQKEMHKYEKEAKQKGKGSFAHAWALDESAEERERGITMNVGVAHFESKKFHIVVLDSPGHKDFVPNMISGAAQADAAILVIDASVGSFEAGMESNGVGGQTKEHAQLVRSFGVEQLIVAVNKMDAVDYSKERYDFIKTHLGAFLRSCGFKESLILWLPISAIENQNLVSTPTDAGLSWYKGFHLLDAIDSLRPPEREISKPLRLPLCDVIKLFSQGQTVVSGKLEAGAVRNGTKVMVMPSGDVATVRSIEKDSQTCNIARAGDSVDMGLHGVDSSNLMAGDVLCHPDFPVAVSSHLELKVLVLDIRMPILVGSQVEFHIHHAKGAAKIEKIVCLLDPKTGKESKKAPRHLISKQSAVIEVILEKPCCVEEFSTYRGLGRAFLRQSGKTVAVGIVTRILD